MLADVILIVALIILAWEIVLLINRRYDLKKRGFTIGTGYAMWSTKRGLNFIDRVAGVSKRGWRAYGTVAAGVGIFAMFFILAMVVYNIFFLLTHPAVRVPGVVLVYPGLIPWLPVIPWIISLTAILLVHELSHGILLRAQDLRVKSVGAAVLAVIFGAFVESDDKQLARAPVSKRLRMYAVGSMANFILGAICLVLLLVLLVPKPGVYLYGVPENYAENFTLGSRIYQLDNVQITTFDNYKNFFENKRPGDNVLVGTENENVLVTLVKDTENENRGVSGLWAISAASRWDFVNPLFSLGAAMSEILGYPVFHPYAYDALVPWEVIDVIKWMFVLNLGVGLFNMLPAVPFDGGYMMQAILERKTSQEKAKRVVRILSYAIFVLILMSMLPAFLR
jgi:membrane-associated protease RseP (regulator of RpoE activity)